MRPRGQQWVEPKDALHLSLWDQLEVAVPEDPHLSRDQSVIVPENLKTPDKLLRLKWEKFIDAQYGQQWS